jgi:hypothetical protein
MVSKLLAHVASYWRSISRMSITASLSQTRKQEEIWAAAKTGDESRLRQCLVGATADDFRFEKVSDEVRFRKYTFWLFP